MRTAYLPYYLSRAVLSALFSLAVFGVSWVALLAGLVLFGLFLFYLHGGWFRVDPTSPLFPLRRDQHARDIQRKSLIAALAVGLLLPLLSEMLTSFLPWPAVPGSASAGFAAVTYLLSQFYFFLRAQQLS